MSYTFHRAWIAALATGAMAASGLAIGAPALAATPAPDAIFYRRVVDFPGNVTADGTHHYTFTIAFSDIQAAWSKAGHTDALPATVKLVAWGSDVLPSKSADVVIEPVALTSLDFGIESGKLDLRVGQQTNIGVTHMPENANMTKVNWSGDDIDVLNVDKKSGLVTAQKEGCSDVRAVADYQDRWFSTR